MFQTAALDDGMPFNMAEPARVEMHQKRFSRRSRELSLMPDSNMQVVVDAGAVTLLTKEPLIITELGAGSEGPNFWLYRSIMVLSYYGIMLS